MSKPITNLQLDIYRNGRIVHNQMIDRVEYIVKTICKEYGIKLDFWHFPDAPLGSAGEFKISYCGILCLIQTKTDYKVGCGEITWINPKNTEDWFNLFEGIPKHWLTENFEEALTAGRLLYEALIKKEELEKKKKLADKKAIQAKKDLELFNRLKKKLGK